MGEQGLGTIVLIGAGLETSGVINYIPLLCGRTLKGSIYGGVRIQSDLPVIIEKCINKVFPFLISTVFLILLLMQRKEFTSTIF